MKLRLLLGLALVSALFALGGCATSARTEAMTVQPADAGMANPRLKGSLKVTSVTGGKETNPLWTSQVDDAGFRKALENSLAVSGYLAAAGTAQRYEVSAELVSLDQPVFGLTFDVKSKVNYRLAGQGVDKPYPIEATGTATTSDSMLGVERLRIANERSILENIKAFLKALSAFPE